MGNVVPFISGEEEKMAIEPQKMLGVVVSKPLPENKGTELAFENAKFAVGAQCNRVPVLDGHTLCVSVELEGTPSMDTISEVLRSYKNPAAEHNLPSAPKNPIQLHTTTNHPQPRIDLGDGFITSVGRVRPCELFTVKMVVLTHNTVVGAAGGAILNAELAKAMNYL